LWIAFTAFFVSSTVLFGREGMWWKGCPKQHPKASFSAAFSQVQRLMRLKVRNEVGLGVVPKAGR
jgi:hypothetical protein